MAKFDECFNAQANPKLKPRDLEKFWLQQLTRLKVTPHNTIAKKKVSGKILVEHNLTLDFQSIDNYHLHAQFIAPKQLMRKPPLIVIFPDYGKEAVAYKPLMNAGIAQLVVRLRGHEAPLPLIENTADIKLAKEKTAQSYGYFAERIQEPAEHYACKIFLDAFRTIEMARLRKEIDATKIGIWGQGIGAAQALFVNAFMNRGDALYLENPAFLNLEQTLRLSTADYAREINALPKASKKMSDAVAESLRYFDPVYFASKVSGSVALSVNLDDTNSVPHGAFALMHLLTCEKDMYVFTENDPVARANEKKKIVSNALQFFGEIFSLNINSK